MGTCFFYVNHYQEKLKLCTGFCPLIEILIKRVRMDFKTKRAAALLSLFWTVLAQDLGFDEDMKSRITARLIELGMEEGDVDIALPVHSRERWQSEECPGFFEDLVTFKLEFNDGLEPDYILMQQVETNDVSHETFGGRMSGKEWIVGTSTVRPFLNCLSWDNEE